MTRAEGYTDINDFEEEQDVEEQGQWYELVVDRDYEIYDKYPYNIRRKGSAKNIKIGLDKTLGYMHCTLNGKKYRYHRVIALQFIPNDDPEHKTEVDHIDRDRANNYISNLRWVTRQQNLDNRSGKWEAIYTDEIADDCIEIKTYGKRELDGYYYDVNLDQFYNEVDGRYRMLNVVHDKSGKVYVNMYDVDGVKIKLHVKKFKKDYELE